MTHVYNYEKFLCACLHLNRWLFSVSSNSLIKSMLSQVGDTGTSHHSLVPTCDACYTISDPIILIPWSRTDSYRSPLQVNKSDSSGCPLIFFFFKILCVYQWTDISPRVPELCLGGCSVDTSGGRSTIDNNDSFLQKFDKRFLFVFILASRKFTSKAQENQGGFFHVLYDDHGVHSIRDPAQWGTIHYLLSDCSGHFSSLVHLQGISR